MNANGDTFIWPDLIEYASEPPPLCGGRPISSLHNVSEASESQDHLVSSPPPYSIKLSPSQAERKRLSEGDGRGGKMKVPKSGVSVSDLVTRLHKGPSESQVLLAAKSSRQMMGFLPQPPPGRLQAPTASYKSVTMWADMSQHDQKKQPRNMSVPLNLFPKRKQAKLPPLVKPVSPLMTPDLDATPSSRSDLKSEPAEVMIDDLLPSEKRGISFLEPASVSVMAAQSSYDQAQPLFTTPTMFSPSLPDPSPANREKKQSGKVCAGKGSTSPSSIRRSGGRLLKKNTYDDSVPTNRNFLEVLTAMRSKLGWSTVLPDMGAAGRASMATLKDMPDPAKNMEAAMNAKRDDGYFVYLLPKQQGWGSTRTNPYDLEVVSANEARQFPIYYTASASNVTQLCQRSGRGEEAMTTPVMQWLWERRLFNKIFVLPIFSRFRIWKSFTIWKNNTRRHKNTGTRVVLHRILFKSNEVLLGCLLHIRSLCEAASSSTNGLGREDAAISLVKIDSSVTLTLNEFLDGQQLQREVALKQLTALRDTVVDIVWQACVTVAELEGVTEGIHPEMEEKESPKVEEMKTTARKKKGPPEVLYSINSKYGKLPVYKTVEEPPAKPTYAQITEWRKILHRLSYFLKLIDYIMLELLRRLVVTATSRLLTFVNNSFTIGLSLDDDSDVESVSSTESFTSRKTVTFSPMAGRQTASKQGTYSMTSSMSSSLAQRTPSNGSRIHHKVDTKKEKPVYIPPEFDFSKVESVRGSVNIDEVLDEINQASRVIRAPEAVMSVQLVLTLPNVVEVKHRHSHHSRINLPVTPKISIDKRALLRGAVSATDEMKKAVTFNEPEYESNESEGEDSDVSSDELEEEDMDGGNRFSFKEVESRPNELLGRKSSLANIATSSIVLSPTEDEMRTGFRDTIMQFEETVFQMTSMLEEPRLKVFYAPPSFGLKLNCDAEGTEEEDDDTVPWPDTGQLFGEDDDYQLVITDLMQCINNSIDMVLEYSQEFNQYCKMVDQASKIDVAASMQRKHWSTDEFQHVLSVQTEQVKEMNGMRRTKRVGLVQVHTQQFCDTCLPYPENIISIISRKLPEIALKKNLDLLTIIKGATRKLDHFPESVEEFVDHLSFLGKIGSEMTALNKEYNVVIKLYTIAKDFELPIVPEDYALYQTLSPSFQHLKTVILYAEAKKEDNIRKFSHSLDKLIRDIKLNIGNMKNRVSDPMLLNGDTMAIVALEKIKLLIEEVSVLLTKGKSYANYQERFGSSGSHMKRGISEEFLMMERQEEGSAQEIGADLSELEHDLTLRRLLWESQEEWEMLSLEWLSCSFDSLGVENLQKHVNRFSQTIYMLEKGLPSNDVVPRLNEKVMSFKQVMPGIISLRNPYLKARHWEEIEKLIGRAIDRDKTFTLGNLLEMNLTKHKDKIQDISTMASNEATLERMLQKVIDIWQNTDFRLVPHSSGNVQIIAGADDILTQLEESQVTIGTIRGSRYVTPIKGTVEDWERKLALFGRTLEEWMTCQRNWLYLEQIFCTPDIQRQLPTESKLFGGVDKAWKEIMRKTEDKPNALRAATASGVLEMLQVANTNLEKIQKCLEDYLETKRLVFPRFYFLSNDELLDILSQSKNPDAVQPHLDKCFGNIKSMEIKTLPRQPPTVKTMISSEGEIIAMPKNVRARGPVEQWLGSVESGMFDIVKKHLKLGLQDWSSIGLDSWVLKHPGQVILTVAQIMFNKDVLACFAGDNPLTLLIEMRDKVVGMLNMLAGLMSANLVMYKRLSINALLTIDVHNRDIIFDMIENKIDQKDDFEWTRQLRYEWDERSNNCNVLQSNATFHYGYEYLGCSPRLVITPLTDRCYLTLCGALHLHLGGSPAGPAGTGKTETVKDLAKAMGKQCVVFNCSEGLDFKMLAKFFSGLAQSGSWCCFDEFNRIDIEVLSVVAQQIHTIKTAKDQMAMRFLFEGREIKLNMTCGFFITMNPSYAGRVELPDNLKSLFRPVAMMVPDYALIAEIILFSEGFTAAKSLSTKLVNLYQLASKQLSQQDHYDFGMRAIKSVLVMAGQKKRYIQMREPSRVIDEEEEAYILIHSLQDANMPKFLSEDVPLFESIMADLFPGIKPPQQNYSTLEKAISMSVRDLGLQYWPQQVEKVRQLYNQVMVRHGVMLVGPTGGGKTTTRNILQKALVLLPMILNDEEKRRASKVEKQHSSTTFIPRSKKGRVETFTLNPKCIKLGELYGETDMNTYEWTDGLIAIATRRFSREHAASMARVEEAAPGSATSSHSNMTSPKHGTPEVPSPSSSFTAPESVTSLTEISSSNLQQAVILDGSIDTMLTDWQWIILDGPVDTLWVENLNTVLDDSKVLCLANGERIALTPGMRLLFEVDDLSQASPATISRCAMVYMDPVDLGWRPYVKTWLQRLPKEMPESAQEHLFGLFELSVDKGMTFIRQNRKYLMLDMPELSLIMCLCNILKAFFEFMLLNGGFGSADVGNRPGSAESGSGHSRCSSSKAERRRKRAAKKQRGKDSHLLPGDKSKRRQNEKQYFLQRNPGSLPILLGKLFVFAFTWSYGGNLKRHDEPEDDGGFMRRGGEMMLDIASEFDNFIRELFEVEPPYGVRLPASSRSIYGYFVDMDTGNFVQWDILVPATQSLIEKGAMITIGETMGLAGEQSQQGGKGSRDGEIVPTVDTVRYSFLAGLLLTNRNSVLLTGDSGVGKTVILESLLKQLGQDGGSTTKSGTVLGSVFHPADKNQALLSNISTLTTFGTDDDGGEKDMNLLLAGQPRLRQTGVISTTLQFSAQTTADRTKLAITQQLVKKGKDVLGAPKGKKVIVFLDDLNMPALEQYGAQPPLELLRQFMELGGFYDTHKLAWKEIHDVTIVGACAPPGGGRNVMSPRLLKHFCMLALPQPSSKSLQHIYQVVLGRFFQDGEYMPEVKDSLHSLVAAAIAIYYRMCANMRPTPAKIQYTFNIRDLSKVITGLLQADETVIVNSTNCAQLFAHEATRVFHDRLVDKQERILFYKMLSDNLHDYFKVKWDAETLMSEPVLFADFLDLEATVSRRIYRPVTDPAKLRQTLEEFHMRLNISNTSAPMVFFRDAIEHILRAARVFRQPGGHILMVGLDGTGKSSIVKLAAYIVSCELYKLTLTRGYGIIDFEDDIKKVFLRAGVKGHNTVFLITDADIVNESFLEDVNSILNSGEVPDLFDNEEIDGIAMDLEAAAVQAQVPGTRTAIYQFFVQRVKKNLHIVLAMSPAGNKFRQRCRMNPSLINCCTIDWFNEWDREAMLAVAHIYFQNADFICDDDLSLEDLKDNVAQICVDMHDTVAKATTRFWDEVKRRYYVTPSSYMELILIYSRMLKDQKTEFITNRTRLQVGLSRLSEANDMVGTMKLELVTLGPRIEEKARDTEVLLKQLEKDQEAVDQVREIVLTEEVVMKRETEIVQEYADACQADLASVIPSLHAAITSLDSLDKADISEIRVYAHPPALVIMVMAAVCVLLEEKTSWATAKQVLGDPQFLKKLVGLDKNAVPERVYIKLKRYTKHPDFTPEKVGQVSVACKSMCQWVLALENYHEVYKMAKPKQKKVKEAKEALAMAQSHLANKQTSLAKIQAHFEMLQQQYVDSVNQRESLKEHKVLTALRLERASILIEALSNEKVRWEESVHLLDFKLKGLVGNTLVSAGMVAYVGPFTSGYRQELAADWLARCHEKAIPISEDYEFVLSLVEANQVLRWNNEGLPNDSNSTQNAIIMKKARKWPLLIDPQCQASQWIQQMEGQQLKCVNASDSNYLHSIERAIRIGEAVLLQEVTEDLDPSLKPILLQNTFVKGGHTLIKIGDTEIEYNNNFRLYLATSLSNPHYLPAICIQVTLINFTVTFNALQEQLLSSVVKQEQPQLENDRSHLLQLIANDQSVLRDLEDKSLSLLQKSQGHILDDYVLVETLQASKGMSEEMYKRVQNSRLTEQKLSAARKKYLPVATRGAVLYFVLADLATVDVMYQFSLTWFYEMFSSCIDLVQGSHSKVSSHHSSFSHSGTLRPAPVRLKVSESTRDEDLAIQLNKMISRLTTSIYKIVSVALFAHHQLMFSFMVSTSIMRSNAHVTTSQDPADDTTGSDTISQLEWHLFLQGNIMAGMLDDDTCKKYNGLSRNQLVECRDNDISLPTRAKWISDMMWRQCQNLEAKFDNFSHLCQSIVNTPNQWATLAESHDPYHVMVTKYNSTPEEDVSQYAVVFPWERLSSIQRLILVHILCPSTLTAAIRHFVFDHMGTTFLSSGTADLQEMYDESSAKTPFIFILSPGSDPAAQLLRFAKELRGSTLHLDIISLGRGQGPRAEELILKAQILKGRWIFLQNCHLAASWMLRLQSIVNSFNRPESDVDPQFRLWLSSKPDPSFPVSILQMGLKMTVEQPQGLKANLLRSFGGGGTGAITQKLYEESCTGHPEWRTLLFGLCFFNAVIHERKKYGRLGWNIPYEFSDSDLEVSVLQLEMLLEEQENIPWPALWYLTGEVTYGGRVTDEMDRRCLHSLLQKFYHPNILQHGYYYSNDKLYHPLPQGFSFTEAKVYIDTLPAQDDPQVFGMNENAEKAYLVLQAGTFIETILSVQPRIMKGLIGDGRNSDQIALEIAADITRSLPKEVDIYDEEVCAALKMLRPLCLADIAKIGMSTDMAFAKTKYKEPTQSKKEKGSSGEVEWSLQMAVDEVRAVSRSALFTVLRQEIDRFNHLLSVIHQSLKSLQLAINGEVVMSEKLDEAYNAILKQQVPAHWQQFAYESCKSLPQWVADLIQRVTFFSGWAKLVTAAGEKALRSQLIGTYLQRLQMSRSGSDHESLPSRTWHTQPISFWLSGFFFPQGFLTAVLQNHARKLGISVDSLTFEFAVINNSSDTDDSLNDIEQKLDIQQLAFTGQAPPVNGVLVFGLYIDGARWDVEARALSDALPGNRFSQLPQVHFIPNANLSRTTSTNFESPLAMFKSLEHVHEDKSMYECPLYRTSSRAGTLSSTGMSTNFITTVSLPSDHVPEFWVMRGVALLCQLNI